MLVSGAVQQAPRAVALAQAPIAGSGWTPGRRSSLSVTGRRLVRASAWVESGCLRRSDEAAAIVSQFQPADHRRRRHEISGVDPRRTTAKRHAANTTELRIMTCRCNEVVAIIICSCYYVPKQQHVMSLASPGPHLQCTRFTAAARSAGTRKMPSDCCAIEFADPWASEEIRSQFCFGQLSSRKQFACRANPPTQHTKQHLFLLIGASPRSNRGSTSSSGAGIVCAAAGYPDGT